MDTDNPICQRCEVNVPEGTVIILAQVYSTRLCLSCGNAWGRYCRSLPEWRHYVLQISAGRADEYTGDPLTPGDIEHMAVLQDRLADIAEAWCNEQRETAIARGEPQPRCAAYVKTQRRRTYPPVDRRCLHKAKPGKTHCWQHASLEEWDKVDAALTALGGGTG